MPSKKNKAWDKNCLSNGGLKRQITTRYLSSKARETSFPDCLGPDLVPTYMELKPLISKGFFEKSACKLAQE